MAKPVERRPGAVRCAVRNYVERPETESIFVRLMHEQRIQYHAERVARESPADVGSDGRYGLHHRPRMPGVPGPDRPVEVRGPGRASWYGSISKAAAATGVCRYTLQKAVKVDRPVKSLGYATVTYSKYPSEEAFLRASRGSTPRTPSDAFATHHNGS